MTFGNRGTGLKSEPPITNKPHLVRNYLLGLFVFKKFIMASELPYFRFTVQEWQNGNISLERFELQGLFISICGFYWLQDCSITLALLQKKFNTNMIQELIDLGIIKHENRHDKIEIVFLNKQYDLLSEKRKLRQSAGSKGGNAKAKLKQKGSYKDKDNNKDNDKIKTDAKKHLEFYQPCLDFWLKEFHPDWTFGGQQGKALKSILKKIEKLRKNENDSIVELFKLICLKLPDWYKDKDLQIIDSKFNEIIEQIKTANNGKSTSKTNDTISGINRILAEKGLLS